MVVVEKSPKECEIVGSDLTEPTKLKRIETGLS